MGFNKIILQGNLSEDITLRYTNNGTASAKVSIAVGKKFKKQDGSQGEKTLFVKLQFWGRSSEILNQYCRKGSKLLIEGELENNNWEDNQGNKKYDYVVNVSNMVMLDTKNGNSQNQNQAPQQQGGYTPPQQGYQAPQQQQQQQYQAPKKEMPENNVSEIDIDEDTIPF